MAPCNPSIIPSISLPARDKYPSTVLLAVGEEGGLYPEDDDRSEVTWAVTTTGGDHENRSLAYDDSILDMLAPRRDSISIAMSKKQKQGGYRHRTPQELQQLQPQQQPEESNQVMNTDNTPCCSHSDQILVDTESLIDLKMQLASQREKVDILSSQLSLRQLECEALKAENEELIQTREALEEQSATGSTATAATAGGGGFFSRGFRRTDSNTSKLVKENAKLHMSVENIRKTFQNYIKISRRNSQTDMERIEKLERENEMLRRQLNQETHSAPEEGAQENNEGGEVVERSQKDLLSQRPVIGEGFLSSFTTQGGVDDWEIEGVDIEG